MSKELTVEEKVELFDWLAENWDTEIFPDQGNEFIDARAFSRVYDRMFYERDDFASAIKLVKEMERGVQLSYVQSWADHYLGAEQ